MKKFKMAGIILLAVCLTLTSMGCVGIANKEEVGKGEILSVKDKINDQTDNVDQTDTEASEKPDVDEKLDLGINDGDIYKNSYFGLSVKLPIDWKIATEEDLKQVMDKGKDLVAGDDESKKVELDLAELNTVYLLMLSKAEMTGQTYKNGNFMIMAEKLNFLQGISKGSQYLESVKKQLQDIKDQMPYNLDKPIYPEKIGGKDFAVLEAVIESDGMKLTQKYYAYVMKGYALVFIGTSTHEDYEKIIQDMLNSVKFE